MALRDLYSNFAVRPALVSASYAASANGIAIDVRDVKAAAIHLSVGAITGAASFSAKLQDSADGVTFADAPVPLVQSDAPGVLLASSSYRLGYLGGKRYFRVVLTLASGTSAILGATAVVEPLVRPVP
jgi:hypothetical protein